MKKFLDAFLKYKNKRDLFLRAFSFNLIIIIIFTFIYYFLREEFTLNYPSKWMENNKKKINIFDCFLTSTSVQGRIGITNILPISDTSKSIMILHELIMIMSHLFGIIFFVLF
jgi:hypothetical protein